MDGDEEHRAMGETTALAMGSVIQTSDTGLHLLACPAAAVCLLLHTAALDITQQKKQQYFRLSQAICSLS